MEKIIYKGKEIEVPDIENMRYHDLRWNFISKTHPEFYDYVNNLYPDIDRWIQKLYMFKENIKEWPRCPFCGKLVKFRGIYRGFDIYCSKKCSIKHALKCSIEKYGPEGFIRSEEFLQKMMGTYGAFNIMQTDYGKQTMSKIIKNQFFNKPNIVINETDSTHYLCKCPHPKCNKCESKTFIISKSIYSSRLHDGTEICTKLLEEYPQKSTQEVQLCQILDELGYPYQHNVLGIISNDSGYKLELDIYCENKNIAFEINGAHSHSLEYKKDNYHINKFFKCVEKKIQLYSLWEEWFNDLNKIRSFIIDIFEMNDLTKYKSLWFPELKENEWPLDLGWYKNAPPDSNEIIPHYCKHGKPKDLRDCCDSGIIITH